MMDFVNRLCSLKAHDPKTYESLVKQCVILGLIGGAIGTLWIELVIYLFFFL